MKLYIGKQPSFNECYLLEAQGVKTYEVAVEIITSNIQKILIINIHTLLSKFLNRLFILEDKYKPFYPKLEIYLHSNVLLPFRWCGSYESISQAGFKEYEPEYDKTPLALDRWFKWHKIIRAVNNNLITQFQAAQMLGYGFDANDQ